ncbi:MAG TPA: hypothetical protein VGM88_07505 [Kofleriaceae bacterium]
MAPNWKWLLAPLLVGGLVVGHHACTVYERHRLANATGEAVDQFLVEAPAGPRLVLHDKVEYETDDSSTEGSRLVVLDARTGAQIARDVFADSARFEHCWPAAAARLWCVRDRGALVLLSSDTLAPVADVAALVAAAGLGKPVADRWARDGASVSVVLPDGRGARIASDSLTVTELPVGVDAFHGDNARCHLADSLGDGSEKLSFSGSVRHVLLRGEVSAESASGTPTGPAFLATNDRPQFLLLEGSRAMLVLSDSSLDDHGHPLISRVDATPALLWSVPLDGGCEFAAALDDVLVVAGASSDAWPRARGLDLASGAARWAYHP